MTDKAFYNIQNDMMDNNQSNLLREVEKEIHRSYHEDSDEQALALLNAFVNIVKAKCAITIPVDFNILCHSFIKKFAIIKL